MFVPVEIPLTNILGAPTSSKTGINILGARTNAAPVPVVGTTGTVMFELVVPKVIAAVPVPVFRTATLEARVGVLGVSCKPVVVALVVRSSEKVSLSNFKEGMIVLLGKC